MRFIWFFEIYFLRKVLEHVCATGRALELGFYDILNVEEWDTANPCGYPLADPVKKNKNDDRYSSLNSSRSSNNHMTY